MPNRREPEDYCWQKAAAGTYNYKIFLPTNVQRESSLLALLKARGRIPYKKSTRSISQIKVEVQDRPTNPLNWV